MNTLQKIGAINAKQHLPADDAARRCLAMKLFQRAMPEENSAVLP
jgi:hypothetical protein